MNGTRLELTRQYDLHRDPPGGPDTIGWQHLSLESVTAAQWANCILQSVLDSENALGGTLDRRKPPAYDELAIPRGRDRIGSRSLPWIQRYKISILENLNIRDLAGGTLGQAPAQTLVAP